MSYFSEEDDVDIRVNRRGSSPRHVRYVQSGSTRPTSYYGGTTAPIYAVPEHHLTTVLRSHSHERSRSRDRRASSPPTAAPAPVIINNRIYNEHSSDDEDYRAVQVASSSRRRRKSRSRSRSRSRSGSSSYMTREDWEAAQTRKELELMKLSNERDRDQHRALKEYREEADLKRARQELEDMKLREARADDEERIRKEIDLKRMRDHDAAERERKRREQEAEDAIEEYKTKQLERQAKEAKIKAEKEEEAKKAVERYKKEEIERLSKERDEKDRKAREEKEAVERWKKEQLEKEAKERKEREERDEEYKRRLEEDLYKSGFDQRAVAAILKRDRDEHPPMHTVGVRPVPPPPPMAMPTAHHHHQYQYQQPQRQLIAPNMPPATAPGGRPTFTRMSRRYLSMETLQAFHVDFDVDHDPEFVIIKRWVPEWEQDQFWRHTKAVRDRRDRPLMLEGRRHEKNEPDFEWVRKKRERSHSKRRSRSPSFLEYFAGAKHS